MRPQPNEVHPYFFLYIDKVKGEDGIQALEETEVAVQATFSSLTEEQWSHRYAPGKWSPKEMLGHLIDSERVFLFRALSAARGEKQPLPGYEQDDYVLTSGHHERTGASLLEERKLVRASGLILFRTMTETQLHTMGTANNAPVNANAILFLTAGHDLHHLEVLKERYL